MVANSHEYFEEIEIEHHSVIYYASGCAAYSITECVGGDYEGYAFELFYKKELCYITINDLWYYDEDTGNGVDILGKEQYKDIERIAEEFITNNLE